MKKNFENLAGQKFNKWTALEYLGGKPAQWLCQCDCGAKHAVNKQGLKDGRSRQCIVCGARGRPRHFQDLTGNRYGKWTVLCRSSRQKWACRCECGRVRLVFSPTLVNGSSTRCMQCDRKKLPPGESAFRRIYQSYKRDASRRGLDWNLTMDQVRDLVGRPCYYTGLMPSNVKKYEGDVFTYNGIDRVDNDKGYRLENCVPCCRKVNEMKMDSSLDEFLYFCRLVVENARERE